MNLDYLDFPAKLKLLQQNVSELRTQRYINSWSPKTIKCLLFGDYL